MSYHARIMNIPASRVGNSEGMRMYRLGHRDARHAAAEIALEAEAEVEELRAKLKSTREHLDVCSDQVLALETHAFAALAGEGGRKMSVMSTIDEMSLRYTRGEMSDEDKEDYIAFLEGFVKYDHVAEIERLRSALERLLDANATREHQGMPREEWDALILATEEALTGEGDGDE